jgi:hypothetical protein
MKKLLLLGVCLACMPLVSSAQFWEFGGMLGASNYSGDLSPTPVVMSETHPAVGGIVRYNVNRHFTMKGNIYYGTLSGSDENTDNPKNRARNLSFKTNLLEVGANAEINLTGFEAGSRDDRTSPYLFAGLCLFKFDPMAEYTDPVTRKTSWIRLQPLGTEGQGTTTFNERHKYPLTQVAIPFGAGFKHNFAGNWNFGMELGWRKTFTDYIDDVSLTYVPDYILRAQNGEYAANLSDRSGELTGDNSFSKTDLDPRGNPTNKDWYFFGGVTITYTILPHACYSF